MDGHLQFWVPCPVQEKQQLVVVTLCEQIICQQNHQRLVRCHLRRVRLEQLKTLVNEVLLYFLLKIKRNGVINQSEDNSPGIKAAPFLPDVPFA